MFHVTETLSGDVNFAGLWKLLLVRDIHMIKSTLLLCAGIVLCSSPTVHAHWNSEGCSDGSCELNQRAGRSHRRYLADNNDVYRHSDDGYGHQETNCRDGKCSATSAPRPGSCEAGSCEEAIYRDPGARAREFPYASDHGPTAGHSRRLDNPFRPASDDEQQYNNDRFPESDRLDFRPIPTSFQPTSYESRRSGSQGINWNPNIRDAIDQAAKRNRTILVQVSAPWCPHCIRMKEKTYTHRELTSLINERFVAISVDADQQRDFIKQMGIQSLPTTLIVAPDLQVLKRLEGFQSANQLMQVMSR